MARPYFLCSDGEEALFKQDPCQINRMLVIRGSGAAPASVILAAAPDARQSRRDREALRIR